MKKRNIAIVAGGDSSECEVSLRSAAGIQSFLDAAYYESYIVEIRGRIWQLVSSEGKRYDIDKNDFSVLLPEGRLQFDYAYITIHGTPGENGLLQGYFEMLGIPYSCCGVLAAALTFHKFACNQYLRGLGMRVAESINLRAGQKIAAEEVVEKIGLPCFIKPSVGGSSFGVTKVKSLSDIQPAIELAFSEGNEVLIEALMEGTEVTCGCYKTKDNACVFPVTEVVTQNEFFDYDAKYNGQVDEITPARLSDTLTTRVQNLTSVIYDIVGAKGIIRIDYIIEEGERINLLEVNTTPGMTPTSFIPQQVAAAGLTMTEVLRNIIEDSFS